MILVNDVDFFIPCSWHLSILVITKRAFPGTYLPTNEEKYILYDFESFNPFFLRISHQSIDWSK